LPKLAVDEVSKPLVSAALSMRRIAAASASGPLL
jgi:hypothetical protein